MKTIELNIGTLKNHRILIIDDNVAIHEDFRKILTDSSPLRDELDEDEAALFGDSAPKFRLPPFEIDSAFQGQEGLDLIEKSRLPGGRPYALAFVDVRMPPGLDGIETTRKIWEKDPDLQVVLCTAFADYSWQEMLQALGYSDRMVILKKPFDHIEVSLLAISMTEKWRLNQESKRSLEDLQVTLAERTQRLKSILNKKAGY